MEEQTPPNLTDSIQALEERVSLLERVVKTQYTVQSTSTPAKPTAQPVGAKIAPKEKTSKEIEIGQKWLTVVGVVLIFLAALFFVQYVFKYVGPWGKILISYLGAAVLFGVSSISKRKYTQFSAVVGAGAWGVTYLVTYAMHFIPGTLVIASSAFEMLLLTLVVGALLLVALSKKSHLLLSLALILGFLTTVLSPLSLFSIIGTVILFAVLVGIAVVMPWGDFILPSVLFAYGSYFFWFNDVLGNFAAQGGGILEKEMLGIIALIAMLVITGAGLLLRRDESKAFGKQHDALAILLAGAGTSLLGLLALENLTLILTTPRVARGLWFIVLAGLISGWAAMLYEYRKRKDPVICGALLGIVLLMTSIAYFLPEQSTGTALAWSILGFVIVVGGVSWKSTGLAAMSILPLAGSVIRFIGSDLQKSQTPLSTDFSLNLLLGIVITLVVIGSAFLMHTIQEDTASQKKGIKMSGLLYILGMITFFTMVGQEFEGPLPSILWGLAGLVTIVIGFTSHWKDARIIGLFALAITVARVFFHDLGDLEALPRVISFAILGGLLLLVGYGYSHNREKLQKYL